MEYVGQPYLCSGGRVWILVEPPDDVPQSGTAHALEVVDLKQVYLINIKIHTYV